MAYCKYCGRELADGEICNCRETTDNVTCVEEEKEPAVTESEENSHAEKVMAEEHSKNIHIEFLNVLKAPCISGNTFIKAEDLIQSTIFIVFQALLSGIFSAIVISKINRALTLGGSYMKGYKISAVGGFFSTLLFSIIFSAVFIGLFLLVCRIAKVNLSINQAISIGALRSIALSPMIAFSCIITVLNISAGIWVFFVSGLFAVCFVNGATKEIFSENKEKSVYIIFAVFFVFTIISSLIMSKVYEMYIPSYIKNTSDLIGLFI